MTHLTPLDHKCYLADLEREALRRRATRALSNAATQHTAEAPHPSRVAPGLLALCRRLAATLRGGDGARTGALR